MTAFALPQKQTVWFVGRLALTVAILAILWTAVGSAEIAETLVRVSPVWLAASVATLLLQTALSAQRWRVTAEQLGQTFSASYALREYFLSQVFNQTLPGAVVGDAARAVRAREHGGLLVASQAVFFERLAGQIILFLTLSVAFACTLAVDGGLEWPKALSTWLVAIVIAGLIGLALLFYMGTRSTGTGMARWLQPLHSALFSTPVLPTQMVLGTAIVLCNLLAFGFAARAVGVDLSFAEIAALVPLILFAMLIPLTVSGWGVREGAAMIFLPIAGASASASVAASIVFGIALLISVAPGAFLVLKR